MASRDILHTLPQHLVWAIRTADVLSGEFLRPISVEAMTELEVMGLASSRDDALTPRGIQIRSWLMCGTEHAPREVAKLLQAGTGSGPTARFAGGFGKGEGHREMIAAQPN